MNIFPELKAVATLMEDTDPIVRESVDRYFREHFCEIERLLPDILNSWEFTEKESSMLFDRTLHLNGELSLEELASAVREDCRDCIYEWFLLNKMILISADFSLMSAALIHMSGILDKDVRGETSPWKKAEAFNSSFSDKLGLVRLTEESIPLSALLPSEVVDTNEGIPLVIDMLYVFLAGMSGFPFRIYIHDGRFMPAWMSPEGNPLFLVDLENEGRLLSPFDVTGEHDTGKIRTEDLSSLLVIYAAVMSDIFFASGESGKGRLMQRAHEILING